MQRRRAVLSLVLVATGATLLFYGLFCHADDVWPADEAEPNQTVSIVVDAPSLPSITMASVTTEPALIREVTIGGLVREASGQLKKTYSGQAPKACPT